MRLAWSCTLLLAFATSAGAATPGLQKDVRFDGYSPLATTRELFERETSPLWNARFLAEQAANGQALPDYTVDLGAERFAVYVPAAEPPQRGHGLMVFVPPWPQAAVPKRWLKALDKAGVIFVTSAHSGNDASVIPRRVALALHGYANVAARHRIDPERVYVGGFSGGARVALRIAIAYPDVFRGALLDGGSDDIGSELVPLPTPERLRQAQERLRLVYLYGSADEANVSHARYSAASAREVCIADVHKLPMKGRGHEAADGTTWQQGLALLEQPRPAPPADLAACRTRVEAAVGAALAQARELVAQGDPAAARKALLALDTHYAHLALPASLELWRKLPEQ